MASTATLPPMSDSTNPDPVLYERREPGIALLTLNRPERLNAWNGELAARYFELLDQAAADPEVKVIVVTGAGKGFCAGADMDTLQGIGNTAGRGAPTSAAGGRPQHYTTTVPKPVIAAVNGACAGIGMVQALMCDIRFAAAGAKFTTAFSVSRPHRRVRHVVDHAPPDRHGAVDGPAVLRSGVPRRGSRP